MPATFILNNLSNQETVYQRCLLITGYCETATSDDDHVKVTVNDKTGQTRFREQRWPMCQGHFKVLVILHPGENVIRFTTGKDKSLATEVSLTYVPLLQTPPLHLAIMVAKDSPLMIDCPPGKYGALSSAHSSLTATISKFRVTAYMWQALTAEEMHSNGLGRRSFRLEEEWTRETLSAGFADQQSVLQTTAKVHLVRCRLTVAELRQHQYAQQNPSASKRDELHAIFKEALLDHGAPFIKENQPVVAGMILDSHYDASAKLITAHAALGAHDPRGLSLGIFGSHLTYSWPRFMEEIPDCLLDTEVPGDRVGNDNGECDSMWEACSIGQGAFLHEVGHAFSAPHSSGIMVRGYSKDWPKCSLSKTAYCRHSGSDGIMPVTGHTPNDCHWDIRDLLRFMNLPHFRLPCDMDLDASPPSVDIREDDEFLGLTVSSSAGLARVTFNQVAEAEPSATNPLDSVHYTLDELEGRFDPKKPLEVEVTSMNGKQRVLNVWDFFKSTGFIRIPGAGVRLMKKSVAGNSLQDDDCRWMVMLKKSGRDGKLVPATKIDVRVGAGLDGAVVFYRDGSSAPCGLPSRNAPEYDMGGHQARKIAIPAGVEVAKVAVAKSPSWDLGGLRIILSNGKAMGALNKGYGNDVEVLAPEKGHRIVGFYGRSGEHGMCREFGIVTVEKDQELSSSVYTYLESQRGQGDRGVLTREDEDDNDTSEDEDCGYDNESDTDTI